MEEVAISSVTKRSRATFDPSLARRTRSGWRNAVPLTMIFRHDVRSRPTCAAFVMISFSLRPQPDDTHVLVKADRLVRIAGEGRQAH